MSVPADIAAAQASSTAAKSLYVGNLSYFVTEDVLRDIFSTLGRVAECKVIKDKQTGLPAGYGFVRFEDHRSAELALASINGRVLYNQELRVNWAFQKEQTEDTSAHFHIFVGDLSAEVNDFLLKEAFSEYSECSDARVLWDHVTGRSKSYGFVSFRTRESAEDAIRRFNGEFIGHRRVRCSWAQHKQDPSANDYVTVDQSDPTNANGERPLLCTVAPVIQHDYVTVDQSDPTNANVYVGNLAPSANDQELRQLFERFGVVVEVKLYRKGSYAFVHFQQHEDAVNAIVRLNGQMVGGKPLKCSWGRHQARQNPMNMAMLSMIGPQAMVANQHPMMPQLQAQQLAAQQLSLQQQMMGMSLGGQHPQTQNVQMLQQQQLQQQVQQQQEQQLDPSYLYGIQGGMLPPGGLPGMFFPPGP